MAHGQTTGLLARITAAAKAWGRSQYELVTLAAELADGIEWAIAGSPTPAHWLAAVAEVEACTAREWIRIGRVLRGLSASADAFASGRLSYAKVRTLTRVATPENEAELVELALGVSANDLGRALARWLARSEEPEALEEYQHQRRCVRWRTEGDGTVAFHVRLAPLAAGTLIAALTTQVMRTRPRARTEQWPTVAQQYADGLLRLLHDGTGGVATEVILHVRGDGASLDDGAPVPVSVVERIAPASFIRALIHDAEGRPINASGRQRHPTARQRRVVKERDRVCVDCGRDELLQYDHVPDFDLTRRTVVDELRLRCTPCHDRRHAAVEHSSATPARHRGMDDVRSRRVESATRAES